ncbi:hypothetical protein BELL_1071g00010 [Botrytis elliptica]|uniref:Uncharacterized protein n=1 Tax=Botrytis elliptica TaxID=278938 RepID=A0A4Z1ISJ2_9HELO|nr:hypothetical protein BELL_1071g00010 [Botrytis elliptica]
MTSRQLCLPLTPRHTQAWNSPSLPQTFTRQTFTPQTLTPQSLPNTMTFGQQTPPLTPPSKPIQYDDKNLRERIAYGQLIPSGRPIITEIRNECEDLMIQMHQTGKQIHNLQNKWIQMGYHWLKMKDRWLEGGMSLAEFNERADEVKETIEFYQARAKGKTILTATRRLKRYLGDHRGTAIWAFIEACTKRSVRHPCYVGGNALYDLQRSHEELSMSTWEWCEWLNFITLRRYRNSHVQGLRAKGWMDVNDREKMRGLIKEIIKVRNHTMDISKLRRKDFLVWDRPTPQELKLLKLVYDNNTGLLLPGTIQEHPGTYRDSPPELFVGEINLRVIGFYRNGGNWIDRLLAHEEPEKYKRGLGIFLSPEERKPFTTSETKDMVELQVDAVNIGARLDRDDRSMLQDDTPNDEINDTSIPQVDTLNMLIDDFSVPHDDTPNHQIDDDSMAQVDTPSHRMDDDSMPRFETHDIQMREEKNREVVSTKLKSKGRGRSHEKNTPIHPIDNDSTSQVDAPNHPLDNDSIPQVDAPNHPLDNDSIPQVDAPNHPLDNDSTPQVDAPNHPLDNDSIPQVDAPNHPLDNDSTPQVDAPNHPLDKEEKHRDVVTTKRKSKGRGRRRGKNGIHLQPRFNKNIGDPKRRGMSGWERKAWRVTHSDHFGSRKQARQSCADSRSLALEINVYQGTLRVRKAVCYIEVEEYVDVDDMEM